MKKISIILLMILALTLTACSSRYTEKECPYKAAHKACEAGCEKSCGKVKDWDKKKSSCQACKKSGSTCSKCRGK